MRRVDTPEDRTASFVSSGRRRAAASTALLCDEHEYAVDVAEGDVYRRKSEGLSHAEAMAHAEALQRRGKVARVVHLVGDASHEVDRYPPR